MPAGRIILVTGGARSGKSEVAEQLAAALARRVVYLATAGVGDGEMAQRVRRHRERRPQSWDTVEETHLLAEKLLAVPAGSCVLVDCLTLWITNLLLDESLPRQDASGDEKEAYILEETQRALKAARDGELVLILVSNQVGSGLVPDNELGRRFRDIAGRVNQQVAAGADRVYLVTAGIPLELKSMAAPIGREVL
ncbi:MAG: bifunctional adenosylcobinamide kinase/adenosylcobinamide-phosphate guanylyltransferase [Firmicutes bacterium]|nr:bifunctional adenosylcobinamide kinase/adenosylcobinamide-phosphate guanylyltransferase [Bacillota bacterium]